jgi:hypothetical protein
MGRSAVLIASERKRRTSSPPVTCIVNDARLGGAGVCGKGAADGRECSEPVCADHLCQYRRSNGHRCKKLPLRLASRLIYNVAGWYPDTSESVFCEKHEKHNCMGFISGTVRCSAAKIPGQAYCRTHAVVMCKWQKKDSSLCAEMAYPQSIYCGGHCWCGFPFPLKTHNQAWKFKLTRRDTPARPKAKTATDVPSRDADPVPSATATGVSGRRTSTHAAAIPGTPTRPASVPGMSASRQGVITERSMA